MHSRHHIFNFHIGFWGALLISTAVTIQSALFMLITSSFTLAQTVPPIQITQPTSNVQVLVNQPISLESRVSQSTLNSVVFVVTNSSGQSVQINSSSSDGGTTWKKDWVPTIADTYTLSASVINNQGQLLSTSSTQQVSIDVISTITSVVSNPDPGEIVSTITPFEVTTSAPVDSVRFDITSSSLTSPQSFNARAKDSTNRAFTYSFDPSVFTDGVYTLLPVAILGTTEFPGSTVDFTIQNPSPSTFDIQSPQNNATISGPLDLIAIANETATNASFQITNSANVILANIPAQSTDGLTWTATFDTSTIPNTTSDPYALSGFATINGTAIPTSTQSLFVNNVTQTAPPVISTTTLPTATVGTIYNTSVVATQGTAPYLFSITAGQLPSGLVLTGATGVIAGTPTKAGDSTFTIQVTDTTGTSVTKDFTITVAQSTTNPTPTTPVTNALGIDSSNVGSTTVAQSTIWTIVGAGGVLPYKWSIVSGTLPPGMSTSFVANDLMLTGTPTTPGTYTFTVQLQDATGKIFQKSYTAEVVSTVQQQPTTNQQTNTNTNTNTTDTTQQQTTQEQVTLTVREPINTQTVSGNSVLVRLVATGAVNPVKVSLINSSGQNVLQGSTDIAKAPFGDSSGKNWTLVLDTTKFANGSYTLRGDTTDTVNRAAVSSAPVSITIRNGEETPVFSGSITSPAGGQTVAGKVPLIASLNGDVQSLMFILTLPNGTTKQIPGIPDNGNFEAQWDSVGVPGGTVTIKAQVIDLQGVTKSLNTVTVNLRELRTTTVAESTPEQVVDPKLVTDFQAGVTPSVPVDCQLEDITDEDACSAYLDQRRIQILNEREEEILREEQLPQVVTRHIDVTNGEVSQKQGGEKIEDPFASIIPVDKKTSNNRSFLVLGSTEPPEALKPFIQQTVSAVMILDQDQDTLPDDFEIRFGTNPQLADTDGDEYDDATEIKNGFNPNGPGKLNQELAPVERAILNQIPLDQPRFAGAVDNENLAVAQAVSDETSNKLRLSGKAEPNTIITIFIYSQLPIVVTTKTDAAGNWVYEMEDSLVDGKHEAYVAVTNEMGKIERKSSPLSFFVDGAQAVSEEEFLANVTIDDTTDRFLLWYLLGGFLAIALGGFLFFFFFKNRLTIPE